MKNIFLSSLLICLTVFQVRAQEPLKYCGTDEVSYELYQNNPQLQSTMLANRDALKTFTQEYISHLNERSNPDSLYIIPVVFHVIHTYGTENISDEQLMSGLKVLNWNLRKQNPDTASIVNAFKPIAADCEIEFHLAHIDPNGHCTSGINRIASTLTSIGDHSVKDLVHWDPSKYLNIYVVKQIANLAGHCLMPDQAAAKPEWDGIVIDDNYVGDMGTASDLTSVVMAHEAGHYLNLFHIWGGNNVPNYYYLPVGQLSNCGVGDDVSDTPPTIGWSNCNLSAASCGNAVDNVQNAMDYSYCNFMFTQGQRQRMRAALNSTVAQRNNLITSQNISATGVDMATICKAAFTASRYVACTGDSIFFTDRSIGTRNVWAWHFGDGGSSPEQNPGYVFYTPGDYYVTLSATSGNTTVTSDSVLIRVNNSTANYPFYVQGFDSLSTFSDAQLFSLTDNSHLIFILANAGQGYNSQYSAVARMIDTTPTFTGRSTLISPAIDLSDTISPGFSFRYAFSQKTLNNNDQLEVFISNDCGKTWISKGKKTGPTLRTVTTTQTNANWAPQDSMEWKTFSFTVPNTHTVSGFMFKIEFTNYKGNALYIDNINVNPEAYTGIEKLELQDVELQPNPARQFISVTGLPEAMPYQIIDINGKACFTGNVLENAGTIDISPLPSGLYLLWIENESSFCNKRFVKY